MPTTAGVTSFVMGRSVDGNRHMVTLKSGVEYDLDPATIQYETTETKFPTSV